MKISKIVVCAAILFTVVLAPLLPRAHADVSNVKWLNTAFTGTDPYYSTSVSAYQTGTTATLYMQVATPVGLSYINVTGAKLVMSWNGNYTAGGLPIKIGLNSWAPVTISFTVPPTTVASNLGTYTGSVTVNYTTPTGAHDFFFASASTFAVYTSDQASAMSIMQQLGFLSATIGGVSACGGQGSSGFKTAAGSADCQQAVQQFNLGRSLYTQGNFTSSNSAMKNALNDWNNAVSSDSGAGAGLDLGATLGAYGSFLLGIGGVIGAVALLIYVMERPKQLRAMSGSGH